MTRSRIIGAITVLVMCLCIFWTVRYLRASTRIARVQELREQLNNKLPDDQRRQVWGQLREAMDELPQDVRDQFRQQRRQEMENRMDDHIKKVLAMEPAERIKLIDKEIDDSEKRRQEWEKRQKERAAQQASKGGPQAGNGGRGNGGPGGGGRGGPGGQGGTAREKRRLDNSTADQRSERYEYRRLVEARRVERGLPATPPGGGGRGRRG